MKILILCNDYQYEHFLNVHHSFLNSQGHAVDYLSAGDGSIEQRRGFGKMLELGRELWIRNVGREYDVILTFGIQSCFVVNLYKVSQLFRFKNIAWYTGFSWENVNGIRRLVRFMVEGFNVFFSTKILTDSKWQRREIRKIFRSRAHLLANGSVLGVEKVKLPCFGNNESTAFDFAVVGRICEEKGALWLLRVLINNTCPVNLHFYGNLDFDSLESEAEFLRYVSLHSNVFFHGAQPFSEIAKRHRTLIAPSFREGLPMALLDAQSYGMNVIARDISGHREAVVGSNKQILFTGETNLCELVIKLTISQGNREEIALGVLKKYRREQILEALNRFVENV
jgi:glycosyltransferase involved in cell wall biosynthesis